MSRAHELASELHNATAAYIGGRGILNAGRMGDAGGKIAQALIDAEHELQALRAFVRWCLGEWEWWGEPNAADVERHLIAAGVLVPATKTGYYHENDWPTRTATYSPLGRAIRDGAA